MLLNSEGAVVDRNREPCVPLGLSFHFRLKNESFHFIALRRCASLKKKKTHHQSLVGSITNVCVCGVDLTCGGQSQLILATLIGLLGDVQKVRS